MASGSPLPLSCPRPAAVSRSDLSVRRDGNVIFLDRRRGPDFALWARAAWGDFLRDRFSRPEDVAARFGVRNSTAWCWWQGTNRPTGDVMLRALMEDPAALDWFLARWRAAA